MRWMSLVIALLCVVPTLSSQPVQVPTTSYVVVPSTEPREHPVDIDQMDLRVAFQPFAGKVLGDVTHRFRVLQPRVDSIVFDGIQMVIKQATLNGRPIRYRRTDTTVIVYCEPALRWDATGTISFTYEATPRKGLYFIGWNDPSGRMIRQIWTQGQAFDHRHWIPMYDDMNDKMITTTTITFDSTYTVISNGEQRGVVSNSDGTRTWSYAMTKPHSNYLLMLAIGMYRSTTFRSSRGVDLECYWYPWKPEAVEPTYQQMATIMDYLEQEIGVPYPWGSVYRQIPVADYIHGAMENTTATIFGDFYHSDERGQLDRTYLSTNIHELVHQWFGDLITGRSRTSLWLQESFATFYPHLYLRSTEGQDAYEWSRRQLQERALAAGRRDRLPIVHPDAGSARYYPKGAAVIDMMRSTFGEDAVRRVLRKLLTDHAYGLVETNDLYQVFQDTLGLSPRWFFDQWLYRGGEPHYRVSWNAVKGATQRTIVDVEQIHTVDPLTGYFRMPVWVQVWYTDGTADSVRAWVDGPYTRIDVPNTASRDVAFVLFDPGSSVLKNLTFVKSVAELRAQVSTAPRMIDRYDALVALGSQSIPANENLELLTSVFDREPFHAMRSEALEQAGRMVRGGTTAAYVLLDRGLRDAKVDVRKVALRQLSVVPADLKTSVEGLLMDPSFQLQREAFQKLTASYPADIDRYLRLTEGVTSPHAAIEITRTAVLASRGDSAAVAALVDYASPAFEFITRQNAMEALVSLGVFTPSVATVLVQATLSTNDRLADRALSALSQMCDSEPDRVVMRECVAAMNLAPNQKSRVQRFLQ